MSAFLRGIRRRDRNRLIESSPFVVTRLRKDGQPSGMHDAKSFHQSELAARGFIDTVRGLNPGSAMRYSINGAEV